MFSIQDLLIIDHWSAGTVYVGCKQPSAPPVPLPSPTGARWSGTSGFSWTPPRTVFSTCRYSFSEKNQLKHLALRAHGRLRLLAEPWRVFPHQVHLSDQEYQGRSDFKNVLFQSLQLFSQWLYHSLPKINWHLLHDVSVLKRHLTSLIESYFCRLCVCQTGPLLFSIQDMHQHTDYCEAVNFKSILLPDHLPHS